MTDDDLLVVRLLEMPLVLRERSRQHGADLLREMTLIRTGRAGQTAHGGVPDRLLELADELDTFYGPYIASSGQEMDAAVDRGEGSFAEVVYRLPPQSAQFVQHIADLLAEVEDYCRAEKYLLTLAPPRRTSPPTGSGRSARCCGRPAVSSRSLGRSSPQLTGSAEPRGRALSPTAAPAGVRLGGHVRSVLATR